MSTPSALRTFTVGDIKAFRDREWEQREHSYHQVALEEVNTLVRKYNGLAPYAVRRHYYILNAEIEKLFQDCAEDVSQELAKRVGGTDSVLFKAGTTAHSATKNENPETGDSNWGIRDLFRAWLESILSKFRTK